MLGFVQRECTRLHPPIEGAHIIFFEGLESSCSLDRLEAAATWVGETWVDATAVSSDAMSVIKACPISYTCNSL